MCRSVPRYWRAFAARSCPTFMMGTISQSSGSAASSPLRLYVIPPHSSIGTARASRPWMTSHTKVPMTPMRFFRVELPITGTSHATHVLLLEARHGAHHTRRPRQRARHDLHRAHRGAEGAAPHLGAERHEERVARRGDA